MKNTRKTKPYDKQARRHPILSGLVLTVSILAGAASLGLTAYVGLLAKDLPPINPKDFNIQLTSQFYDDAGELAASRYYTENRVWVEYDKLPKNYVNAVVAIEDKNFWEHDGVDFIGIFRALLSNLRSDEIVSGASTITQQLARNILIDEENRFAQDYNRKIREALIALNIEEVMNKEEILTYYSNVINFGQSAYGLDAASYTYFGKGMDALTLDEAALLAGIPQSPVYNNPANDMASALDRRNRVLNAMYAEGYITEEEHQAALNATINLSLQSLTANPKYGYFIDQAIREAESILEAEGLPSLFVGGYDIYTTMDSKGQELLEGLFADKANFPPDVNGTLAQGAMVVYDQQTGDVKAMSGGRDYVPMGLNRVYAKGRQPGSTFKPIAAYGPAIEMGLTASDTYIDGPINISGYKPQNSNLSYRGEVTVRQAVASSINTIAVQVLNDISPRRGWEFATRLGIEMAEDEKYYLSIALGGVENGVTPMEMVRAYGTFGNDGVLETPHLISKIVNRNGVVVYKSKPESEQAISPTVAWYITDLLRTVVNAGTGTAGKVSGLDMAGKTGTAQMPDNIKGNKDIWFVGYTPEISASVWMGFDQPDAANAFKNQFGGGYPARLWKKFMTEYLKDKNKPAFQKPEPLDFIQRTIVKKNIVAPPAPVPADPGVPPAVTPPDND